MSHHVVEATDTNFQSEVIDEQLPTLVDFWAPWCGPCVGLTPTIEAIATEKEGSVKVCKLNVDDNPETAAKYGIRGIPTMILFKNGEAVAQLTGAVPKQNIEEMISSNT